VEDGDSEGGRLMPYLEHPHRIGFKAEFQNAILQGIKTGTIRMKDLRIQAGDELSAVSSYINDKGQVVPDFLVPASKRFATIECTEAKELTWSEVTPGMIRQTTVGPSWYYYRYPNLKPETPVWFYQFKVIEEALKA